jgi:hypothetical protein
MILRPVLQPLTAPLLAGLQQAGAFFSPTVLFSAGEQGGWWDPSDFSTMYQDSAGTTPVTAVGQPVGRILDKSGRGNHRTQATAASRPTLRQDASGYYYLEYDGVDDSMATGSVDFSGTDKMTVFAGINKASDVSGFGMIVEIGDRSAGLAGSFSLTGPETAGTATFLAVAEGATGSASVIPTGFAAPISRVITVSANLGGVSAADQIAFRANGVAAGTAAGDSGGGNFGSARPMYFGRRGGSTLPFNGREYQTIIRGAASTAAQIAQAERFVGSRMGISL